MLLLLDCILACTQIKLFPHMLWMQVGQNTLVCPVEGGTPYWAKKRILSYMFLASQQGIVCRVSSLNHCIQLK